MNYLRDQDEFAAMVSRSNQLVDNASQRIEGYKDRLQSASNFLKTVTDDKQRNKLLTSIADVGTEAGLKSLQTYISNPETLGGRLVAKVENTNVVQSLKEKTLGKVSNLARNKAQSIRENVKSTQESESTTADDSISFGDSASEPATESSSLYSSSVSETDSFADAATNAATDVESFSSGLVDSAAEGIAGGLDALGDALDATGVGAVLGVGLNLAGLGVGIYGAIEGGESAYSWFKEHILHKVPTPNIGPPPASIASISQKFGSVAVPTLDTASNLHSSVGAW
jgi:hypothetical protein